ncbi:MAG TPA: PAS domain S-box protein [Methanoculleus sp.]|nr:PAS domain S-box protein [Methanoculleus sp.]
MSERTGTSTVLRDLSLLYELSLSVGSSLDLIENCDQFIKKLLSKKNFTYAAVWIANRAITGKPGTHATLVYANPESMADVRCITLDHPLFSRIACRQPLSCCAQDPLFAGASATRRISTGVVAFFPLGDIGVLEIASARRTAPLPDYELNQLHAVIARFAISLKGCLAHEQQLRKETEERKRAERARIDSEKLYQTIFESTGTAIVILNPDLLITHVNSEAERLSGYARSDLVGAGIDVLLVPPEAMRVRELSALRRENPIAAPNAYEFSYLTRHGVVRRAYVTTAIIPGTGDTIASVMDITERKQAEESLRIMKNALDSSINGTFLASPSGHITYINDSVLSMWGYAREEDFIGRPIWAYFNAGPAHTGEIERALESNGWWIGELSATRANGMLFDVQLSMTRIPAEEEGMASILCSCVDITERKEIEAALRVSEKRFRELADSLPQIVFETDSMGRILFLNRIGQRMLGLTAADLTGGLRLADAFGAEERSALENFLEGLRTGTRRSMHREFSLVNADGNAVHVLVHASPILAGTVPAGIRGIATDISDQKAQEELIRTSLDEKVMLIKEVHHRVKNNMQVISAILSLQADCLEDESTLQVLRECQNRIISMALIHEKLYQGSDFLRIDFAEYVDHLLDHIACIFGPKAAHVDFRTAVSVGEMDIDTAIPCGMIISELVNNSLKYAFPGDRDGEIAICIADDGDGTCAIRISDNGVGLPEGFIPDRSGSLGLHLVRMLAVKQLQGTLDVKSNAGVTYTITFKRPTDRMR